MYVVAERRWQDHIYGPFWRESEAQTFAKELETRNADGREFKVIHVTDPDEA